jgi:hypothetical protein
MNEQAKQTKILELGDFVCPRYLAKNAEKAIARGLNYQIIKINESGITAQKVSTPSRKVTASIDFFISLE